MLLHRKDRKTLAANAGGEDGGVGEMKEDFRFAYTDITARNLCVCVRVCVRACVRACVGPYVLWVWGVRPNLLLDGACDDLQQTRVRPPLV